MGAEMSIAVGVGDVLLIRNNLKDIAQLLILSRAVYTKMIQNFVWALGYNVIEIPAVAGVFAHTFFFGGFFLRLGIGAPFMSFSVLIVVLNALTLRKINLNGLY